MTPAKPLTIHVYECGCPGGRHSASIPRDEYRTLHDNPVYAGLEALRHACGDEAWEEAVMLAVGCIVERNGADLSKPMRPLTGSIALTPPA